MTRALLDLPPAQGKQIIVVTETPKFIGNFLLKEVTGADTSSANRAVGNNDTIFLVPRMFMYNIIANVEPSLKKNTEFNDDLEKQDAISKKNAAITKNFEYFNNNSVGYTMHNGIRWIVGDKRESIDSEYRVLLSFHENWRQISKSPKKYGDYWGDVTVDYAIKHIQELSDTLEKKLFVDTHSPILLKSLNEALSANGVSKTDHLTQFYDYLDKNGKKNELQYFLFYLAMLFVSYFDLELQTYAQDFIADKTRMHLLVIAGSEHTHILQEFLTTKGFTVTKKSGDPLASGPIDPENALREIETNIKTILQHPVNLHDIESYFTEQTAPQKSAISRGLSWVGETLSDCCSRKKPKPE